MTADRPVVVFDTDCVLCSGMVSFVLAHERAPELRFAGAWSDEGLALAARHGFSRPDLDETFLVLSTRAQWCAAPHASGTTVQRGCPSKNGISSPRRSLRFSCTLPAASMAWSWKTDLAMSRPIMVMLIAGGSLCRSSRPAPWHVDAVGGRPPHLVQMAKGACPDPGWIENRLRDLERLKWLLWHGHARHAVEAAEGFADDAWGMEGDAEGEAKAKLGRLHKAAEEFAAYLRNNARQIVDYGERHRAGERISTGFVESAVNQIVAKRFSKRQPMRWTQRGARLALQARTRVLNGELEDAFRKRWPAFRPPLEPAPVAGDGSFA
jgi:hypothetical protein